MRLTTAAFLLSLLTTALTSPVSLDVNLKPTKPKPGFCQRTGCSGEVCANQTVYTTCVFREEYVCYQSAECIKQDDGSCGWLGEGLENCLEEYRKGGDKKTTAV
ncbi:hypothetical protein HK097_005141 [Rhizophlyctis rosea]|uniref:Uncharacterized protein n=1 Tax=Rhizophlyctis rosea TaxID=64517 RepID=A0AAD5SLK9_9FUNG|nr:hypothetical protein HK097_005141 [Rhizophlyctis rosea]